MAREISYALFQSQNTVECVWLEQGLHNTPDLLRQRLQQEIDRIEKRQETLIPQQQAKAIVLAYGLCSNGVVGLRSNTLPLIVPRCDDCISLFLGSSERYSKIFHSYKGIYWFNKGWIENAFVPTPDNYARMYAQYVEKYGEENAKYLMETETSFIKNYENAFFIKSSIYDDSVEEDMVRQSAEHFGWNFQIEPGELSYFTDLLNGNWDEDRFLVCGPGKIIAADYDGKKVVEGD